MSSIRIPLSRPIEAHGETIDVLELREPNGEDVIKNGLPGRFNADESISVEGQSLARHIVTLAGIPRSSLKQMAAADMGAVWTVLLPFFFPSSDAAPPETP